MVPVLDTVTAGFKDKAIVLAGFVRLSWIVLGVLVVLVAKYCPLILISSAGRYFNLVVLSRLVAIEISGFRTCSVRT